MTVLEVIWRCTQQIIISRDRETIDIVGFGSGFFTLYKGNLFFVTADHVLHSDDFSEGIRTMHENALFIANNLKKEGELLSAYTPIGNFTYFDRYDFKEIFQGEDVDIDVLSIPDMQDVAISLRKAKFEAPMLTHELLDYDGSIIVRAGEPKLSISDDVYSKPNPEAYYLVAGTVKNKIVDGVRIDRANVVHVDMKYDRMVDNCYILKHSGNIKIEEWAGLSGCPVFDNKGLFIGMLIRAVEETNEVWVYPIERIKTLLDYTIKTESI